MVPQTVLVSGGFPQFSVNEIAILLFSILYSAAILVGYAHDTSAPCARHREYPYSHAHVLDVDLRMTSSYGIISS